MRNDNLFYLKKFSDICNTLDSEGISQTEFGSFGMARKHFGQFLDDIENNDDNATEELDQFNRSLTHLRTEIEDKKKENAEIKKCLEELKALTDAIVEAHPKNKN